ncbi:MAG: 4-alpha-glucanotransferase [Chitinophagaceae bacterium]
MQSARVYVWHKAPFLRLILPLIAGILLQWQFDLAPQWLWLLLISSIVVISCYSFLSISLKYKFAVANGIVLHLLIASIGALLIYINNIKHSPAWFGNRYKEGDYLVVRLEEPLVEKANSYKAIATVLQDNGRATSGKLIIYFKKDSSIQTLSYGSLLLFHKSLQSIKNSGNPGTFDYQRYCLFNGITHQVYLTSNHFITLSLIDKNWFTQFTYTAVQRIVSTLKKYIHTPREQGLIEAMLIGYKDDLDKNLVQSYTNTGVVHIIAISGLHLALIYGLLLLVTKPLKRIRRLNLLRILIIIASLWLFSILAGAQASIIRSAVMFTGIIGAEVFHRKTSILNTLALSAFLLLCYNPFWLWDVGFQLSYSAVLSIVLFMKPIYKLVYFRNKAMDLIWQLMAVTLSAQILTTPISIFHFHQFPNLFLLTNIIAVPLSGFVLYGAIVLLAFSAIPIFAKYIGIADEFMIRCLNDYIQRMNNVSIALWDGLYITFTQTVFLLCFIAALSYFLLQKKRFALGVSLLSLLIFALLRSISFIHAERQQKLIVYNVPKHRAIDLIDGRSYRFIGDPELLEDDFLRNFYLQPSRILHRINSTNKENVIPPAFCFHNKNFLLINSAIQLTDSINKPIDVVILSKNPKLYISQLAKTAAIKQIVIDASVPAWKAKYWKHDCDSLHIPCYDVTEEGAFVMNL